MYVCGAVRASGGTTVCVIVVVAVSVHHPHYTNRVCDAFRFMTNTPRVVVLFVVCAFLCVGDIVRMRIVHISYILYTLYLSVPTIWYGMQWDPYI